VADPKKTSERTIAERVEAARLHRGASQEVPPGTVVGAREGSVYAVFITRDYAPEQIKGLRKQQALKGYELATDGEFMIGEADAEIWSAPKEIGDDAWKDEFLTSLLNEAWLDLQVRRPNNGIARKVLELAKKVHARGVDPDARNAAREALTAHVRATPIESLQVRN